MYYGRDLVVVNNHTVQVSLLRVLGLLEVVALGHVATHDTSERLDRGIEVKVAARLLDRMLVDLFAVQLF